MNGPPNAGAADSRAPRTPYLCVADPEGAPPPSDWATVPVGELGRDRCEMVYDPRRYEVSTHVAFDEAVEADLEAAGWTLRTRTNDGLGVWIRDRAVAVRARLDRSTEAPSAVAASEVLRQVAEARRDYAQSAPKDDDRTILLHEVAVMNVVADVLSGAARWYELVADWAPSWRWHEFGDHNPELWIYGDRRPTDGAPLPDATRGVEL